MTLIKSISGFRGTIGGLAGENLTPMDAVLFACYLPQPMGLGLKIIRTSYA